MVWLYILQSLKNHRYYIGTTDNLERRLEEHNLGKSTYTRLTKPFKLVFYQKFYSKKEAQKSERKLKRLKSKRIIDKIVTSQILELRS